MAGSFLRIKLQESKKGKTILSGYDRGGEGLRYMLCKIHRIPQRNTKKL